MIKGVLIKKSLSVDEIVRNLKSRGVLRNIEVIDLSSATAQKCKEIGADVIFVEEESGVRVLVEITGRLGWKKFRVFSFDLGDGEKSAKFYACYSEKCFEFFPPYLYGTNFSIEKFDAAIL